MSIIYKTTKVANNDQYIYSYISKNIKNIKDSDEYAFDNKLTLLKKKQDKEKLKYNHIDFLGCIDDIDFLNYNNYTKYIVLESELNDFFCFLKIYKKKIEKKQNTICHIDNLIQKLDETILDVNQLLDNICSIKELMVNMSSASYNNHDKSLFLDEINSYITQISYIIQSYKWINDEIVNGSTVLEPSQLDPNCIFLTSYIGNTDIINYFIQFNIVDYNYEELHLHINKLHDIFKTEEGYICILSKKLNELKLHTIQKCSNIQELLENKKLYIRNIFEEKLTKINNSIEYLNICINSK